MRSNDSWLLDQNPMTQCFQVMDSTWRMIDGSRHTTAGRVADALSEDSKGSTIFSDVTSYESLFSTPIGTLYHLLSPTPKPYCVNGAAGNWNAVG